MRKINKRLFVRKKEGFRIEENKLLNDLKNNLQLKNLKNLKLYNVYDIFDIEENTYDLSKSLIFSEKNVDEIFENLQFQNGLYIGISPLPEQFDIRANSASECIKILDNKSRATVQTGKLLVFENISSEDLSKIKKYCINPLESMQKDFTKIQKKIVEPLSDENPIVEKFITVNNENIVNLANSYGVNLNYENLLYVKDYFLKCNRNPTLAELKVIDTYWSDHCRHSTFNTTLNEVVIENDEVKKVYNRYLEIKNRNKPVTLMDMGTAYAKYAKQRGILTNLENTKENNACSVEVEIDVDGKNETWLHQFKNETHNHPTEIEPFGGAATCLGGAIRDPLSGRAFVFQGMRISGAADVNEPFEKTLKGKLAQSVISKKSAEGFSSYGNQIGLATTYVEEVVHSSYVVKTLEAGAVIGAVKKGNVLREEPIEGDVVLLIGGRTGKDGIGGATGSSKSQNEDSVNNSGGEVQKGNALEERKLQRLFRNENFTKLIKKSNDFGAGGISVAIGELADSVHIKLEKVLLKNSTLKGFEIALSESQERMAVAVKKEDVEKVTQLASYENLETTYVADITNDGKLLMTYKGIEVVSINKKFLDSNGILGEQEALVKDVDYSNILTREIAGGNLKEKFINNLKKNNVASKKGMIDMFDFSVLGTTVLAPFGGRYQLTKSQSSIQKFPVENGKTNSISAMAMGFNPDLAEKSPFLSSMYGGIFAISKLVANGIDYKKINFSLQEYFEKLLDDKEKWGKVVESLMGIFYVQDKFELSAIGGKDSMSGTFEDKNVVPTLITFAFADGKVEKVISNEFKKVDNYIYLIKHNELENSIANIEQLKANFDFIKENNSKIWSAYAVGNGGLAEAISKMCFGNKIGVNINYHCNFFELNYGSIVIETSEQLNYENAILIGKVSNDFIINNISINIDELIQANYNQYEKVFELNHVKEQKSVLKLEQHIIDESPKYKEHIDDVKVFIPIFPGTNSEYDTKRVFENTGATIIQQIFKNKTEEDIKNSITTMVENIKNSHIIAFCGGFSNGDEPDGSGKFIVNVINNKEIKNALHKFLDEEKLILGTCNGFQALIKSGLVTYGQVKQLDENAPTLATNDIGRHISRFVGTKVITNRSPWTYKVDINKRYVQPISHTEGKFVASGDELANLIKNNQVAFVYTDDFNEQAINNSYNPNGSIYGIEGIISPCGKILGKMAHCERYDENTYLNIEQNLKGDESLWLDIFSSAVSYFKREEQ